MRAADDGLTPSELAYYEEHGFVILRDAFSRSDALDFVKTVFEPAVPANRLSAAARRESWFNVEDLPRYDAIPNPTDVLKYSPRVSAILRQMHEKPFSIRGGEALSIRPARSWLTPQFIVPPTKHWHVDEHGIDGNHDLSCVVLFHFSDTEIGGGGGTAILDGSHKWLALLARCVPRWLRRHSSRWKWFDGHAIVCKLAQLIFRAMWMFRPQAIVEVAPVRAGDATLLHPLTVHAATENSAAMPRYISRFGVHC